LSRKEKLMTMRISYQEVEKLNEVIDALRSEEGMLLLNRSSFLRFCIEFSHKFILANRQNDLKNILNYDC
jgi:hypothetical protein